MKDVKNFLHSAWIKMFGAVKVAIAVAVLLIVCFPGMLLFEYVVRGVFMGFDDLNQYIVEHSIGVAIFSVAAVILWILSFTRSSGAGKEKSPSEKR